MIIQRLFTKIYFKNHCFWLFSFDQITLLLITDALHEIEKDKADLILEIPASFEKDLVKENEAQFIYGSKCDQWRKSRA